METHTIDDKIQLFLEKKLRISRSYDTRHTYGTVVKRFIGFLRLQYNLDLEQLLRQLKETNEKDAIGVLDDFYTFLSNDKIKLTGRPLSNSTVKQYVIFAKEFLNHEGCHVYAEDLRQRFRLPRISTVYERGLTKEIINRLLRLSNRKLATIILLACSSGMRIGEIAQLRLADIDFTTNPVTILIRKETTKTKETRITHITLEATKALQDYLAKNNPVQIAGKSGYIFLVTDEDKIKRIQEKVAKNCLNKNQKILATNRVKIIQDQLKTLGSEELYARCVTVTKQSLEAQLRKVILGIPELAMKNDNGRNTIHFHAFRAWFKTQVTNCHQSDFAEALMGHTSLKLVYYRQNDEQRAKIYREIEPALTISDTEKMEKSFEILQEENQDLRKIVEGLSIQLKNLEKKIERK